MAEKKQSAFALLEILTRESDEQHILSTKEILSKLENEYNLSIERRTLYANIDLLEQQGYVISRFEDNGKGYFLETRQFEKGEVLMLCNTIHASHFVSEKQSKILIKKLLKTLSRHEAKEFQGNIYMPNPTKTLNNELMYSIGLVAEAILAGKMIEFQYMKYDKHKKMVQRRDKAYRVEPRYIVYQDSRAYMIATMQNHHDFVHFRIDRMKGCFLLDEKVKKLSTLKDPYEYARNKLFMYNGEMMRVSFLCHKDILDHMIDLFGLEVSLFWQDDDHFVIHTSTSKTGAHFLAKQYLGLLQIISPLELRAEFVDFLQQSIDTYQV